MNQIKIKRKTRPVKRQSKLKIFIQDLFIRLRRRVDKYFPSISIVRRLNSSLFFQSIKSRVTLGQRNIKFSKRSFFIIVLIFIFIFFLFINFLKLLSIVNANNGNEYKDIDNYEINLGLVIYQKVIDYGEEYKYIASFNIVSIRQTETIILNYDPRFETGGGSIITLLTRNTGEEEKKVIQEALQSVSGLRVDGLIVFEENNFKNFLQELRLNQNNYNPNYFKVINSSNGKVEFDELKQGSQTSVLNDLFNNGFTVFNKYFYFFLNFENIISFFDTNLNINNLITILNSLGIQKRVKNIVFDRNVSNIIANEDGTFSMVPSPPLFKERYFDQYKDLVVFSEQAEVEIYNASNVPGLAAQSASRLSNIGISVTRTGNFSDRIDNATIFIKNENDVSRFKETIASIKRNINSEFDVEIIDESSQISGDIMVVIK